MKHLEQSVFKQAGVAMLITLAMIGLFTQPTIRDFLMFLFLGFLAYCFAFILINEFFDD